MNRLSIILLFLLCACFIGCSKPGSPKKTSPQEAQPAHLDWDLKTLVTAYQNIGSTNQAWDKPAIQALTEFARSRSGIAESNEPCGEIIATNCEAAIKAGCDDPMVKYLYIKFSLSQTNTPKTFSDAFNDAESAMQKSSYPDIRKFYASLRAVQQFTYTYGYGSNVDFTKPNQMLCDAVSNLVASLNDKTMPPGEVYDACCELLYAFPGNMKPFQDMYGQIEKPLFDNWPDESTSWLLKGEAYNIMGSIARGNGYANTVTKEGWKTFASDNAVAEKALIRAWELNTNDARIADKMIWVQLCLGRNRSHMELWFSRAMEDNPQDYDACDAKLNYIQPKWYGSTQDMVEFGRECVQNTNWGGNVPLILVDAHWDIYNQYIDSTDRTNYWEQPDVWADINSAYEKYLKDYPNDSSRIAYYARYAYYAGQWDKLNELLPKVSPAYYSFFGGEDKFNQIAQLAKERASQK